MASLESLATASFHVTVVLDEAVQGARGGLRGALRLPQGQ
jgi:hypothetical protein